MTVERMAEHVNGLIWFKSTYSGSGGGDCVEVAAGPDTVYVRDSKAVGSEALLRVRRSEWAAFLALTVK